MGFNSGFKGLNVSALQLYIPSWYCLNPHSDPQYITHTAIPQPTCKYSEQPVTFKIIVRNQCLLNTHTHTHIQWSLVLLTTKNPKHTH